ncbi:MAG: hypothetical protein LUG50_07830 [Planctomycetaceae bacterium]|nr:hypothetical protein [Planctomycetaceae bacterium]
MMYRKTVGRLPLLAMAVVVSLLGTACQGGESFFTDVEPEVSVIAMDRKRNRYCTTCTEIYNRLEREYRSIQQPIFDMDFSKYEEVMEQVRGREQEWRDTYREAILFGPENSLCGDCNRAPTSRLVRKAAILLLPLGVRDHVDILRVAYGLQHAGDDSAVIAAAHARHGARSKLTLEEYTSEIASLLPRK